MNLKVILAITGILVIAYSCSSTSVFQFNNIYTEIYFSEMDSVYSKKWLLTNVIEEKSFNLELIGEEIKDSLVFMFSPDLIHWGTIDSVYEKRRLLLIRDTFFHIDTVIDPFFNFRMYNNDSIISELDFFIDPLTMKDTVFICKINTLTFVFKSLGVVELRDTVLPYLPFLYPDRGISRLGRVRTTSVKEGAKTKEMRRNNRRQMREELKEYKAINKEWNEKINTTNKMTQTKRYMLDSVFMKTRF